MAVTDFSKQYHEKMFPCYTSKFLETEPEFIERFDNFAFDELINMSDISSKWVTTESVILHSLLRAIPQKNGVAHYRTRG